MVQELLLPDKLYNSDKLHAELSGIAHYLNITTRGNATYAIFDDDVTQVHLDTATANADAHNPSPTNEQIASSDLSEIKSDTNVFYILMPLAKSTRSVIKQHIVDNNTALELYADLKGEYDNADPQARAFVRRMGKTMGIDMDAIVLLDVQAGQFNTVFYQFFNMVILALG